MSKLLIKLTFFFILFSQLCFGQNEKVNFKPHQWIKNDFVIHSPNSFNSFSPIVFNKKIKESLLKVKLGKNNSIFVVYKTSSSNPEQLFTLISQSSNESLNSHFFVKNDSLDFKKGNKKSGVILNYNFNKRKKEDSFLVLNNNYLDESTLVYEILIFNERLNKKEKKGIETYLALKYGISLANIKDYTDEESKSLWDNSQVEFNSNVFGIGRNDFYYYFNTKSSHSNDSILTISFDKKIAKSRVDINDRLNLKNKEYLLVSSNSKSNRFIEQKAYKILDKKWMLQSFGEQSKEAFLTFNCKELGIDTLSNANSYKLVINPKNNDFSNINKLVLKNGIIEKGKLIFESYAWDSDKNGHDYFTIIHKKEIDIKTNWLITEECFPNNKLEILIKDGVAPYKMELTNLQTNEVLSTDLAEDTYLFENLKMADYNLHIEDSSGLEITKLIKGQAKELNTKSTNIKLDKNFVIQPSAEFVEIIPKIQNEKNERLIFEWFKDGKVVSNARNFKTSDEGKYKLLVTNELNCQKSFETTVTKTQINEFENEDWKIYPNPIDNGKYFTIQFNFKEPTLVQYYIYSMEGKKITAKDLGYVTNTSIQEMITQPGVYRILATYKNTSQIKKIIVN